MRGWMTSVRGGVASDAFGNGVVVFTGPTDEARSVVRAVDYSATPPELSGVRAVGSAGFRFRVSEPSRVAMSLWRGRRRIATLRARANAGVNRIRARRSIRRRLAPGTRYAARLRAFDAGRRGSRVVRLRFRAP